MESIKMQQDELEIEMHIWEYLDKLCSEQERERIAMLIEKDTTWKTKYNEIMALQAALGNTLEQEHPSMRFTQNVMDAVEKEVIAPAARTYLNKWVIRGIVGLFATILVAFIGNAVFTTEWSNSNNILPSINLDRYKAPSVPLGTLFYGFIFLNIIAGLILLDSLLKRKRQRLNDA